MAPSALDDKTTADEAPTDMPVSQVDGRGEGSILVGWAFFLPDDNSVKDILINRGVLVKTPWIVCLALELKRIWALRSSFARKEDDLLPTIFALNEMVQFAVE